MGNYYTAAEALDDFAQNELIQLTDVRREGTVNVSALDGAIDEAEADIDSCVSRRRPVPVSPRTAKLKSLTRRMMRFNLHRDRLSVTDDLREQNERDWAWLQAYAAGDGSLGDDADPGNQPGDDADFEANDRVWDRRKLSGW